jgi:hypothetical protein
MVVSYVVGSGSCHIHFHRSNLFVSGIEYYTHHEVFGSLRVYFIYRFCIGFTVFILL